MNMKENTMKRIHLTEEKIVGDYPWKGSLDLLNIVLIGISNILPEREESRELHHLLSALFSNQLTNEEKFEIIEKEYNIVIESKMREDVSIMCNLSQGILEQGMRQGISQGIEQQKIDSAKRMIEDGDLSLEKVALYSGLALEQVQELEKEIL